jgi:ATPase subunit of ABC transporter with duplicated ATPase domains
MTAYEWLEGFAKEESNEVLRTYMGRMLFSGEEALKQTEKLSGGESARLIMTKLMLQQNNVLILDEPTNHLDLEAVSALSQALNQFVGTSIFVSHDRDLIANSATRIIAFTPEGIDDYSGPYEEYLFSKSKRTPQAQDSEKQQGGKKGKKNKKESSVYDDL